jgi:type 2 lantibiotic biosynthesis protein LanM
MSRSEQASTAAGVGEWWVETYFAGDRARLLRYLDALGLAADDLAGGNFRAGQFTKSVADGCREPGESVDPGLMDRLSLPWFLLPFKAQLGGPAARFERRLRSAHKIGLDSDELLRSYASYLGKLLYDFVIKAIVLEVNAERLRSGAIETAAAFRGADLTTQANLASRLVSNYPVLVPLVDTVVANATRACIDTLDHIEADFELVRDGLAPGLADGIHNIIWGCGDAHRRCSSVAIIELRAGTRFVYKPRSLAVDLLFEKILRRYSSLAGAPGLAICRSLSRADHGYCEYVEAADCRSEQDARQYFYKCGHLVLLFWIVGGSDLHFENMIAVGSDPVIVDLETMLDKPLARTGAQPAFYDLCGVAARDLLLKIGIMPSRSQALEGQIDVSAFGASGIRGAKISLEVLTSVGWDMKFADVAAPWEGGGKPPMFDGKPALFSDFSDEFFRGYGDAIEIIGRSPAFDADVRAALDCHKDAVSRWVPRRTEDYKTVQRQIGYPAALADPAECEMIIAAHLAPFGSGDRHLLPLVCSERDDLMNGDVPYFSTVANSADLVASDGKTISGFFQEDAIESASRRLCLMRAVKPAQLASLQCAASVACGPLPLIGYEPKGVGPASGFAAEALRIAEYFSSIIHCMESVPFCVGNCVTTRGATNTVLLPPTLYDGMPGIGLFMAYCYKISGDARFLRIAEQTRNLVRMLAQEKDWTPSCGAFAGYAGLIYADLHLSAVLDVESLIRREPVRSRFRELIETSDRFDIVSGSAGALLVLVRALELEETSGVRDLARMAANRLMAAARVKDSRLVWHNPDFADQILGGLAHGSAGVALALAEWLRSGGEADALEFVQSALWHQLSLFDAADGRWLDARDGKASSFWCHGASGAGLAAGRVARVFGRDLCEVAMERAMRAVLNERDCRSHCLCHGTLGNADLFLQAGRIDAARALARSALESAVRNKTWQFGLGNGEISLGLMCGLAGIGLGLLRLADPAQIPSILTLDGPP